ncbi:glutathione S-transferase [Xanthomonas translucens pv. translucens]|uniref:glutathione S-transferase n=1 Tax=Xanthomonas campestris pv. translucens TaxID=343 RepID=UPI00288AD4DE|nr:glutathione S-transferase [Xanthomonas translucens]WNJ25670.1 glutathione S-transferase [Xanthomonas translucens pv. translucens]
MDWQATELNNAWRYAFMALVSASPAHRDARRWRRAWPAGTGTWAFSTRSCNAPAPAYAAGADCALADIVLGLSTQRWMATPMVRPPLPAVAAYYERLSARPGFLQHGRNGIP